MQDEIANVTQFFLDTQEDQLKGGMKLGDKGFGFEPESHYGMRRVILRW